MPSKIFSAESVIAAPAAAESSFLKVAHLHSVIFYGAGRKKPSCALEHKCENGILKIMQDLGTVATFFKFLAVLGILAAIIFMILSRIGGEASSLLTDAPAPAVEVP